MSKNASSNEEHPSGRPQAADGMRSSDGFVDEPQPRDDSVVRLTQSEHVTQLVHKVDKAPPRITPSSSSFFPSLQKEERIIVTFMLASMCYGLVRTFAPPPIGLFSDVSGKCEHQGACVCPRDTVCAHNAFGLFCLAMAKGSTYLDYPLYMLMFLSMTRNINSWLQTTIIAEMFHFTRLNALHRKAGTFIGFEVFWHTFWHAARWGVEGNIGFVVSTQTGLTGLVSLAAIPFIVIPMVLCRQKMSFELRKYLHYFSSFVWAGSIMFHAPATNIAWVIGTCFFLYIIDHIYGLLIQTRRVPSAQFSRVGNSVVIRMKRPKGFSNIEGTFCYINLPWLSKSQWHAFSLYSDPFDKDYLFICATVAGDWTGKLHEIVQQPTVRRCWIYGPFPSPFQSGYTKDNLVYVATGVGITPVLNAIQAHASSKKVSLVWMCRDAALIEFVVDLGFNFCDSGYSFICYTGKRELVLARELPENVFLLKGRPELDSLIRTILRSTNDGSAFDIFYRTKQTNARKKWSATDLFFIEMRRLGMIYSSDQLFSQILRCGENPDGRHIQMSHLRSFVDRYFINSFEHDDLLAVFRCIDEDNSYEIDYREFSRFMASIDTHIRSMSVRTHAKSQHNLAVLEDHAARKNSITGASTHRQRRSTSRFSATGSCGSYPTIKKRKSCSSQVSTDDIEIGVSTDIGDSSHSEKITATINSKQWKVMYCGENKNVTKTLQKLCSEKEISFAVEMFNW